MSIFSQTSTCTGSPHAPNADRAQARLVGGALLAISPDVLGLLQTRNMRERSTFRGRHVGHRRGGGPARYLAFTTPACQACSSARWLTWTITALTRTESLRPCNRNHKDA